MDENKKIKKPNNKSLIILVAAVVIALGAGFFGGMEYQKNKRVTNFRSNFSGNQQGTTARNGNTTSRNGTPSGSQPVSGEIVSIDDTGITIKTPNGGSKIVVFSNSTVINKTTEGSKSDLKTGDNVMVIGTTSTDGTVTAETVSIGVTGLQFQGGMGEPPSGN